VSELEAVPPCRFVTVSIVCPTFGGREPVASIRPGEPVRIRTADRFGEASDIVDDLPGALRQTRADPVVGPLFVVGAHPGDTLAVHLADLTPAAREGPTAAASAFGPIVETAVGVPDSPWRAGRYAIDRRQRAVRSGARASRYQVDLSLAPMLGTVGVAPAAGQVLATNVAGMHGGNLDLGFLRAGATLFLQSNVEGALLAVGAGRARRGDRGIVQVPMEVLLLVDVIATQTPWPRLETDTDLMSIGVADSLESAYHVGSDDLVRHVGELTGLRLLDAGRLVSRTAGVHVGNPGGGNHSVVVGIDKSVLGTAVAYNGAHTRLRAIAQAGTR